MKDCTRRAVKKIYTKVDCSPVALCTYLHIDRLYLHIYSCIYICTDFGVKIWRDLFFLSGVVYSPEPFGSPRKIAVVPCEIELLRAGLGLTCWRRLWRGVLCHRRRAWLQIASFCRFRFVGFLRSNLWNAMGYEVIIRLDLSNQCRL